MKTFQCNHCGHRLQRPTQPYKCPQCGRQAVGLFKLLPTGSPPPVASGTPPTPPVAAPSSVPPAQPGTAATAPPATRLPAPPRPPAPPAVQSVSPPASGASPPAPAKPQATAPRTPKKPRAEQPARAAASGGSSAVVGPAGAGKPPLAPGTPAAAPRAARPSSPRAAAKPTRPERFCWAFPEQPSQAGDATPLRHAPAVDAHGLIFLHVDSRLFALREEKGRPKICWEYVAGCRAPGPTVLDGDGNLRLHTSDGFLHGLTSTGKQLWPPVAVGEPLGYAAPIVDSQGNTLICALEGGLIKVDARGRRQPGPFLRTRQKLNASGMVHHGVLYVGSEEGCLLAIELGGERGVNLWNHAAGQGQTGWYLRSTPVPANDGILVAAGCDEHLYGFRLDGNLAWKTHLPGQMLGSAVLDRSGHIYVGISQSQRGQPPRGLLVCVDGNSHQIRWQYEAAGPVESTPAIGDDGVIYFGDNTGVIHAVDGRSDVQWTAQLDAAVRSAGVILAPDRLAFGLDNETLVALQVLGARSVNV